MWFNYLYLLIRKQSLPFDYSRFDCEAEAFSDIGKLTLIMSLWVGYAMDLLKF